MKTYLYATYSDEGIIDLVRKDEHDAVVRELNERLTKQQSDMLDTIVQRQLEITKWQSMAERLAMTHKKIVNKAIWPDKMRMCSIEALATYESAKKGEFPDPLAEAVKRMEEVTLAELSDIYNELWADHHSAMCKKPLPLDAVRALLIQAAKGEQP